MLTGGWTPDASLITQLRAAALLFFELVPAMTHTAPGLTAVSVMYDQAA
jgi:hypothetical protein